MKPRKMPEDMTVLIMSVEVEHVDDVSTSDGIVDH